MQSNTYLNFNGNCEEAFKFYEKSFGAKVEGMMTHEGSPAEANTPPEWRKKILHARLKIGDAIVMASDAPPGYYHKPQGFSVSLGVDTPADAERVFKELSERGEVRMPMAQSFFAARFGMVTDRFGIPWIVICEKG
ncbi:MAG: VOC family protein [Proteobacteria bacterium]|nr:VOC family protein [Pseudomonadota bacterium]